MKILYEGTDIYNDISLKAAVHEMHAEGQSDTLKLQFNDEKGLWSKWNPSLGDTIALEEQNCKTGAMFISELSAKNGIYTVRAMSMPVELKSNRTASWENVKLTQLASEIAARYGLTVKTYGVNDQTYAHMIQPDISDISFLSNLCMLEGCQLIIYDRQLVIYDEAYMEEFADAGTITIGPNTRYSLFDNSSEAYSSVTVNGGAYTGTYSEGSGREFYQNIRTNSAVEASRFAKNILKNLNKKRKIGSVRLSLGAEYAPACVFTIKSEKAVAWNGRAFVTAVRNDYVANTSDISFRTL